MHRVEEISLLKSEVKALEADRGRWMAAAEKAAEELGRAHAERDNLAVALDHADGRIIDLTNANDDLRDRLAESERQLVLWIEASNANGQQLAGERHGHAAAVMMLRNDVSVANGEIFDLRQELSEAKAELRRWRGCPSCLEDHPEGTMCPPHKTRVTGQAWRQRQTRLMAERAEKAEAGARELAKQSLVCETDIASMQSALVAAGHEPGCPVVHAASVDCVLGSGCIDWRARAERAEAVLAAAADSAVGGKGQDRRGGMEAAIQLRSAFATIQEGARGNAAGERVAMKLREAAQALDAAVAAMEKGEGEDGCG